MRHPMIRLLACLACLAGALVSTAARAQECVCRLDGASVSVSNLPAVQSVNVSNAVVPVKETDNARTYEYNADLTTGERRAFGPIPLDGRKRVQFQVTQAYPKSGIPVPLTLHWYVRYSKDDAFFDPCQHERNAPICTTGFPVAGAKFRPLLPTSLAEQIDGFYVLATPPVTIQSLDVVGAEALLIVENLSSGPRQVRVNLVLDR